MKSLLISGATELKNDGNIDLSNSGQTHNLNMDIDIDILSENEYYEDLLEENNCIDDQYEEQCKFKYECAHECDYRYNYQEIDLGAADCLSDDDLWQNLWISESIKSEDIMDHFWEGEYLYLCQDSGGGFYTEYICNLNRDNQDIFKFKYICTKEGVDYRLCNEEICDSCELFGGTREISKAYLLYQKFAQPIEV